MTNKFKYGRGSQWILFALLAMPISSPVINAYASNDSAFIETVETQNSSETTDIASGLYGTSAWRIDSNKVLHIEAGSFPDSAGDGKGPWRPFRDDIEKIVFEGEVFAAQNSGYLFQSLTETEEIENLFYLNTSQVTNMQGMFSNMQKLKKLDLSTWDTSQVTNVNNLISYATSLTHLNLTNWNTSKVTDMHSMFAKAYSLEEVNLWSFDTTNVSNMRAMFEFNNNLSKLILGPKFKFKNSPLLPEIPVIAPYTGKWVNVGSGSPTAPSGKNGWSSSDLMKNYNSEIDADTYVWETISLGADVKVQYIDESGKTIANSEILQGNIGDRYESIQKDIEGYTFKEVRDNNATGAFSEQAQTVTYIYTKDQITGADVIVRYVDEKGDPILGISNKTITGNIDDVYDTATSEYQISIPGYHLAQNILPENMTGQFTDQIQEVIYTYIKNKTTVNVYDSSLFVGEGWSAEDNFDSAVDKEGNPVDFKNITVIGEVNTSKEGSYEVIYRYEGVEAKAIIKVLEPKEDLTHITVHDSLLKVGDEWSPVDNFDEATDFEGNIEDFSNIFVEGDVDTTKPGTYEVIYSIPEEHTAKSTLKGYNSAIAKVVVSNEDIGIEDSNTNGGLAIEELQSKYKTGSSNIYIPSISNIEIMDSNENSTIFLGEGGGEALKHALPQTGEDKMVSYLTFISGIVLLISGLILSAINLKKVNKKRKSG